MYAALWADALSISATTSRDIASPCDIITTSYIIPTCQLAHFLSGSFRAELKHVG